MENAPSLKRRNRCLRLIWKDAQGAFLLACIGGGMGLVANQFREKPLPLSYSSKTLPEEHSPTEEAIELQSLPEFVSVSQVRHLINRGVLILDVRSSSAFQKGHIPGSINLPKTGDFKTEYAKHARRLEEDKTQPIILYCASRGCQDARLIRASLQSLGYTNTSVFLGGWREWIGYQFPVEK